MSNKTLTLILETWLYMSSIKCFFSMSTSELAILITEGALKYGKRDSSNLYHMFIVDQNPHQVQLPDNVRIQTSY